MNRQRGLAGLSLIAALLGLALGGCVPVVENAQPSEPFFYSGPPGSIDTTFGGMGTGSVTRTSLTGAPTANDQPNGVSVDNQGRIVVAGFSISGSPAMAVWRFDDAGNPDPSFGNLAGGVALIAPVGAGGAGPQTGNALSLEPGGNILIAGSSNGTAGGDMTVWRINDSGALDPNFDPSGTPPGVVFQTGTSGGGTSDSGNAITLDGLGRIVVAGTSFNGTANEMAIWRYSNPTVNDLDTTFNSALTSASAFPGALVDLPGPVLSFGSPTPTTPIGYSQSIGNAVAVDAANNVLVAGSGAPTAGSTNMTVWRYTSAGVFDPTFNFNATFNTGLPFAMVGAAGGTNGVSAFNSGDAIVVDRQGRIVVAGSGNDASGNFAVVVWRFTSSGILDPNFNGVGYVTVSNTAAGFTTFNAAQSGSLVLDSQGRIIVVGTYIDSSGNDHVAVLRFTDSGALDDSFNGTGIVTRIGTAGGTSDAGDAVTVDAHDRIVVVGTSLASGSGGVQLAIWRINP